ncbi:hypothetical protein RhiJN_19794 [Ceratobasidium sp. AG-Ba]|nr:hypothetical protein RhiJN_04963 [Ceratobasidium sp. AG-Ba]QRV91776.1 hypothetical protein RhiJN_19794 [Ceratobasidium sp. AG-Ba]
MFLQPLAFVSVVLKTIFFTALTREDVSTCLTIAAADIGLRSAHLATYIGLSHSGLQLPVGSFFPPPSPMTSTDIALYVTPIATAVWTPSRDAVGSAVVLLADALPEVVPQDSAFVPVYRALSHFIRLYDYHARLLGHKQPVVSQASTGEDYLGTAYNQSYSHALQLFLAPGFHVPFLLSPLPNCSSFVAPSPLVHPEDLYDHLSSGSDYRTYIGSLTCLPPSELSSASYRAPISAAISLGQCTPYRVFPAQVEVTVAMDVMDEPRPKFNPYTELLDELEEPKECSKNFVIIEPPSCIADSCALVVFAKLPEVAPAQDIPAVIVVFICCHIWAAYFMALWICLPVYQSTWWICHIQCAFVYCSFKRLLKALLTFMMDICDRLIVDVPTSTNNTTQYIDPPFLPNHLPSSPQLVDSTSVPDLVLDPRPALVSSPPPDVVVQSTPIEPLKYKEVKKKVRFEPASIPLPKDNDDELEETALISEPVLPPILAVAPELTPASSLAVDSAVFPSPEDDKDGELSVETSGNLPMSSSHVSRPSDVSDDDGGGWTTLQLEWNGEEGGQREEKRKERGQEGMTRFGGEREWVELEVRNEQHRRDDSST